MQDADIRSQRRRKVAKSIARRERKTNLLCFGIAAMLSIFVASAFLLKWFLEAPPFMP